MIFKLFVGMHQTNQVRRNWHLVLINLGIITAPSHETHAEVLGTANPIFALLSMSLPLPGILWAHLLEGEIRQKVTG